MMRRSQVFTVLLTMVLSLSLSAHAENIQDDKPEEGFVVVVQIPSHALKRYPYGVTFLKENQLDSLLNYVDTDLVPIIFRRNKTDLILPNEPLDSIVGVINRITEDPEVRLAYVWIGGSASPEGPESHNEWLGKTRAKRLYDYLKQHTTLPDSLIRVDNLMEDWRTPLLLIRKDEFPHKQEVIDIWNSESSNALRKKKIMAIDNGQTWEYLIDKPFRPARNARMVIVCIAKEESFKVNVTVRKNPHGVPARIKTPIVVPAPRKTRGQFVALKTNLAALSLLAANVGAEFSFGHGFSFDLPFYYSPYDITEKFRVRLLGIQPELRYWFKRDWPGEGHFVGINGTVAGFDISFPKNTRRYQDPEHALWGAGASYGYAFNFGESRRWGVELNLGLGYMNYKHDTFRNEYNGKLMYTTPTRHYWGITRIGINLTYKWWKVRTVKDNRPKEAAAR